jgi:hypothetical protein
MFLSLVDVISAPQLWVSPDPEYRHLFAPLPRRLRMLMGIHPLFIAPPRSYMIARARKKAAVGVMVRHLQRLDELEDSALTSFTLYYARKKRLSRIKRKAAANRKFRQRRNWSHFKNNMTPTQFRRYFRMTKQCFQLLCEKIIDNVGVEEFKSEAYLKEVLESAGPEHNIMKAHIATTGGFICGEIKPLVLRLLAGGSYLDLALLFETGSSYTYDIFHNVIANWINDDRLVNINGIKFCSNDEEMQKFAMQFSISSNGILNGCIVQLMVGS